MLAILLSPIRDRRAVKWTLIMAPHAHGGHCVGVNEGNGASPALSGVRSRSPWILLVIPGAVGLYGLLGAMWHPLMIGPGYDSFECVRRPWDFVVRLVAHRSDLHSRRHSRGDHGPRPHEPHYRRAWCPPDRCWTRRIRRGGRPRVPPLRQLTDSCDTPWLNQRRTTRQNDGVSDATRPERHTYGVWIRQEA